MIRKTMRVIRNSEARLEQTKKSLGQSSAISVFKIRCINEGLR